MQSEIENSSLFGPTELSDSSFRKLLPIFFEEINSDFSLLELSAKSQDWPTVRLLTHKIKGSGLSYSALVISNKALAIQEKIDLQQFDKLDSLIQELKESIQVSYSFAKENFRIVELNI